MAVRKTLVTGLKPQGRAPKPRAPARGDIIQLDFTPSAGREMRERHPALVISDSGYNARFRFAIVLPITTVGALERDNHLGVNLIASGSVTTGIVLADKPRSVDLDERAWSWIETAPAAVVNEVMSVVCPLIGCGG